MSAAELCGEVCGLDRSRSSCGSAVEGFPSGYRPGTFRGRTPLINAICRDTKSPYCGNSPEVRGEVLAVFSFDHIARGLGRRDTLPRNWELPRANRLRRPTQASSQSDWWAKTTWEPCWGQSGVSDARINLPNTSPYGIPAVT